MSHQTWSSRFLLVAGCVLLAACAVPGSLTPAVKIGLVAPFEGLYRDLGYEVLHAARLAVRERNAAGGVGVCAGSSPSTAYLVELVALNDFNEGREAVWQARELGVDPDVLGVIGGWSPETALAAAAECESLGLAFLAPVGTGHLARLGAAAAQFAVQDFGVRRAAVLSGTRPGDADLARAFEAAFVAAGGFVISATTPDSGDELGNVLSAQPDLLFVSADTPQAAAWIAAARRAGFEGQIVGGPGLWSVLLVEIGGQTVEGVAYVSPFTPVPDDALWREGYEALSGGVAPGPVAAWAYNAAHSLLDAINRSVCSGLSWRPAERRDGVRAALTGSQGSELGAMLYVVRDGQVFQQP